MSKKTERKNKTNLVVKWPETAYFIIEDLFKLQPEAKWITLRVRLSKEIEKGLVAEIGCKTGGQGRPRKVFAFTPVPQSTLDLAESNLITLVDKHRLEKLSTVPSVPTVPVCAEPVSV
jgi:hypothetical protein